MNETISHDRKEETMEAKAAWFQSLSLEERMDMLNEFTDMILENNPTIFDQKDAEQTAKGICILRKA